LVVEQSDREATAINYAPMQSAKVALPPGEYFADVKVAWGESTVNAIAQSFTIDANKDVTHWTARKVKEQW
jgi:hypothetical protein